MLKGRQVHFLQIESDEGKRGVEPVKKGGMKSNNMQYEPTYNGRHAPWSGLSCSTLKFRLHL